MPVHDFGSPERFVVGTVGPPGQRVFFLQTRAGRRLVSVSCEKQQVSLLADRINDLLDAFAGGAATEQQADQFKDSGPLETPVEEEFRALALALAWDPATGTIVVEAHSAEPVEDDPDDEGAAGEVTDAGIPGEADEPEHEVIRVRLAPAQARAFARRAALVVRAGRPNCPLCAGPLDPTGHICPRANGYRR